MASDALNALLLALKEVDLLQRINPTPTGAAPDQPEITRAVGRASVVLLSSHLERYIRNINEEAVSVVNATAILGSQLPQPLRLLHSKSIVEDLAATTWDNETRATKLALLAQSETWLWLPSETGSLDHSRLLAWMKAPKSEQIQRYFRYWEIDDIFGRITYKPHTRSHLWLKIDELVEKRNNIAHGDLSTEATQADVRTYSKVVETFCVRSDRQLGRRLGRLLSTGITCW
jgi:RiboL-PSP-HEPN